VKSLQRHNPFKFTHKVNMSVKPDYFTKLKHINRNVTNMCRLKDIN